MVCPLLVIAKKIVEFRALKTKLLSGTYPLTENNFAEKPLAERGGCTPPSLTDNPQKNFLKKMGQKGLKLAFFAQKSLAERGVPPPPLNEQNPLSSFWKLP